MAMLCNGLKIRLFEGIGEGGRSFYIYERQKIISPKVGGNISAKGNALV